MAKHSTFITDVRHLLIPELSPNFGSVLSLVVKSNQKWLVNINLHFNSKIVSPVREKEKWKIDVKHSDKQRTYHLCILLSPFDLEVCHVLVFTWELSQA